MLMSTTLRIFGDRGHKAARNAPNAVNIITASTTVKDVRTLPGTGEITGRSLSNKPGSCKNLPNAGEIPVFDDVLRSNIGWSSNSHKQIHVYDKGIGAPGQGRGVISGT